MRKFLSTALLATVILLPSVVNAQPKLCAPSADVINKLSKQYDEKPVAMGLQSSGNLLQVFVSKKGTWTVVSETPRGMSCIIAVGTNWEVNSVFFGSPS